MNVANVEILKSEILKSLENTHFHLVDFVTVRHKNKIQIRVFLDRDDGYLSHGDCRRWSSEIKDIIDGKDLISEDYRLEVSSPGIGRPLKEQWEFKKNLEKNFSVEVLDEGDIIKNYTGILVGVESDGINLLIDKSEQKFFWEKISKAKVVTPW
jgi:ribosome maturation factor RimP